MPFAWGVVNIMNVISTPTLERDMNETDSVNGETKHLTHDK